jgi:hypothetical protein
MEKSSTWVPSGGVCAGPTASTEVRVWFMNSSQAGFVSGSGLGTNTGRGPHISNNPLPDIGTGSNGNGVANGTVDDTGTGPGTGGGTDPDDNTNTGQGPGSGPGSNRDVTFGEVALNMAAFSFSKDNEIHSRLGGTFDFIPGASGYGLQGNTYASTAMNLSEKRKAVAYGTIVIPGIETTASTVHPYFENSLGIAGLSAGENSVFDVYFNGTMKNSSYCVILTAESEQGYRGGFDPNLPGDIPTEGEFSVVAVRAGSNGDTKTPSFFRIEQYKKDAASGFWGVSPIAMKAGRTERIHFMVFGETSNGKSWLTNPNPLSSFGGSLQNTDYNVWAVDFFGRSNASAPSVLPMIWESGSTPYIHPEAGYTAHPDDFIRQAAEKLKTVPEGRRVYCPGMYYTVAPVSRTNPVSSERLVQYYAIKDGYTYSSTLYPAGITNSEVKINGITFYGATLAGTRRVLSLYADNQVEDIKTSLENFLTKLSEYGASVNYISDDAENLAGVGMYDVGGGLATEAKGGGYAQGRQLLTNQGMIGNTLEMLFDYYGISAAGSCGAKINAFDPELLRAWAYDPRNTTYQFSTDGVTASDSPTISSRFLDIYKSLFAYYGGTGTTASSYTGAIDLLYNNGTNVSSTYRSAYWATDYSPYQGMTTNNFARFHIAYAHEQTMVELYYGHYRYKAYKPALDRGATYTQYDSVKVNLEDLPFASDANSYPKVGSSPVRQGMIAPVLYGDGLGAWGNDYHLIRNIGYFPNPTNDAEKYYFSGYTYPQGRPYSEYGSIRDGCKHFYPRTALLGGVGGSSPGFTGNTAANTGVQGATIAVAPASGGKTLEVWGGFTAKAGDYIWFRSHGASAYSTPFTVAAGLTASTGQKKTLSVFEDLGGYGLVAGHTFEIERTASNGGFAQFVHSLQYVRAILRGNSEIATHGMCPWVSGPGFGFGAQWHYNEDNRYWWEQNYHLLVSGTSFFNFFDQGGEWLTMEKLLSNWRNLTSNSRCISATKSKIALNSEVFTSGGVLKEGPNKGLYLWRITVRPGPLEETVTLVQNRRQDIPRTLTVPGGEYPDHNNMGTRGVWLITSSSLAPEYSIQK